MSLLQAISHYKVLVAELNAAEIESFNVAGHSTTRLHKAVVELCKYSGIENLWDAEVDAETKKL